MTTLALRDYQIEALDAVTAAWDRGVRRPAVVLPTGAGKTVCFARLAAQAGRALILVHRDELVTQTVAKVRAVAGIEAGVVKAERNEVGAQIVVASVQTLARDSRLAQIVPPDVVIVDEAHHATATTYRKVLDHCGGFAAGFTATMARGDGRRLGDVWQEIVYQRGIIDLIRLGHLADVEGYRLDVPDLDLSGMTMRGGDFSEADLGSALESSVAPETVAACYLERYPGMPAILFAPTVDTARLFAAALESAGVRAATVWGAMGLDERRKALRAFEHGELDVLCSCMVLTEGFDSPRAQLAIIARPTASAPLFVQMVGRVLRPYPGKTKAVVLDVVGATGRHELATLATLGGLAKPVKAGESLLEAWDLAAEEEGEKRGRRYREGRGALTTVDLFGGSRQRWLRTHAGWWFLPGLDRYITIQPSPDSDGTELWDVASWNKNKGGSWLARGVPGGDLAMSLGEADVRPEEQVLAEKERAWRKKKASDKQLAFLASLAGQAVAESMAGHRSGEVGDLISVELASRRIDPGLRRYLS